LILGRRLHRQIGWLLALEDPIDVSRGLPGLIDKIRAIRDQSAGGRKEPFGRMSTPTNGAAAWT
jgi:hypothetical protein